MVDATPNPLTRLARALVGNHIRLSIRPELHEDAVRHLLLEKIDCSRTVIFVIGAGASVDAVGLPAGDETAGIISNRLNVPTRYLNTELDRLSRQFHLDRNEFETQMLALAKFEPVRLREELVNLFGHRFYLAECYEILAHLLKHRFIDSIINFNFDEILDQSISDELEEGNYWRIISDGDIPVTDPHDKQGRLRRPLYIKPHGTVSHGSSLRFTREAYLLIPESITELIARCLAKTPVTLVTVGFRMKSVEFQAIVDEASNGNDIEVIAIDPSTDVLQAFPKIPTSRLHHHDPTPEGLAHTFKRVWKDVGKCFAKQSFARGIERHHLLSELFKERPDREVPEDKRGSNLTNYLRDRAFVELALAVAKAKGFVHVGQLAASRAGRYLREYRNRKDGSAEQKTLYELCKKLGLEPVGYSSDTLRLLELPQNPRESQQLIVNETDWLSEGCPRLVRAVGARLEKGSKHKSWAQSEKGMASLTAAFDSLYHGEEVEVVTSRSSRRTLLFASPEELPSFAATRVYTNRLLNERSDQLWCVAETGEWLTREEVLKNATVKTKGIALIVADEAYRRQIETSYTNAGVRVWIVRLPWWLHNQHMTLAIGGKRPRRAFFFERRLRSLEINPVGLEVDDDLKVVEQTFLAYWAKADSEDGSPGPAFVGPEHLKTAKSKLLDFTRWPRHPGDGAGLA